MKIHRNVTNLQQNIVRRLYFEKRVASDKFISKKAKRLFRSLFFARGDASKKSGKGEILEN